MGPFSTVKSRQPKIYTVIIALLTLSCNTQNSTSVEVSGRVHHQLKIKDGDFLYLSNSNEKGLIIDSARVQNGQFRFSLKTDPNWRPFPATIRYWDSTSDRRILQSANAKGQFKYLRPIALYNPYKENYVESIFYVDHGVNRISPFLHSDSGGAIYQHSVSPQKQTEPYFRHVSLDIPSDSNENISPRNNSVIARYHYSFALMDLLFRYKTHFKIKDLKGYIQLFDEDLNAKQFFKTYFDIAGAGQKDLALLSLENPQGERNLILGRDSEYKLLIFWASWCAPCRAEIPELKRLDSLNPDTKLQLVSISIDNNREHWQKAVMAEKMPWDQYIVSRKDKDLFNAVFNIEEVPTMFLINRKNEIIQRFNKLPDSGSTRNRMSMNRKTETPLPFVY